MPSLIEFKTVLLVLLCAGLLYAGPWPGELPGTEIGDGLPSGYEPSGAVWHARLNKLFTVWDNGMVSMMDYDGASITNWNVSGDLEGVCIADHQTDFIYIGLERPDDGIKEFDISTGQVTRFFDLTPWMQSPDPNLGLECLTFIPDTSNPEGGLFFAGLQENSNIYMFQLPIVSSTTDTHVTYIGMFNPVGGRSNLSGLDYERTTRILYAIWSYGQKKIRAMEIDGTNIIEWDLAGSGSDMEGVALWSGLNPGQAQIFIAEDDPSYSDIWRYDFNSILDITVVGNGSVNLQPEPPRYYGTSDTLTAIPDSGYQFVQWGGDLTGSDNPAVLLMDYDKDVTATFEPTGIQEEQASGPNYQGPILQIIPNPFAQLAQIKFQILRPSGRESSQSGTSSKSQTTINIYDATGVRVKSFFLLTSCSLHTTRISWDGRNDHGQSLPTGIYFCELHAGSSKTIEKLILIR